MMPKARCRISRTGGDPGFFLGPYQKNRSEEREDGGRTVKDSTCLTFRMEEEAGSHREQVALRSRGKKLLRLKITALLA